MSYEERVSAAIGSSSESALISLIKEDIPNEESKVKAKEEAIYGLAQSYVNSGNPQEIKSIATNLGDYLKVFSKPRLAKVIKNLVEYIAKVHGSEKLQIDMCLYLVEWCIKEKRSYLKHRIQLKLGSLYLAINEPGPALKIIEPILIEVRKADDKLLLVELYLMESRINYHIKNFAKAKASLTASRANSNSVYCQPTLIADIDLMSGILYSQDQDYKTGYSYFYEALEPLIAAKDLRALNCFKYMIMCKIMSNSKEDVNYLLNGKFGLRYGDSPHIQAMKAISEAHFTSSIVALSAVFANYRNEIQGDQVINNRIKLLYDNLLEKNLFKMIESYRRVDLAYISSKLCLPTQDIERKLSEMILDKKINGTLDQSKGCLIVYHAIVQNRLYTNSASAIDQLSVIVQKLAHASTVLKKS